MSAWDEVNLVKLKNFFIPSLNACRHNTKYVCGVHVSVISFEIKRYLKSGFWVLCFIAEIKEENTLGWKFIFYHYIKSLVKSRWVIRATLKIMFVIYIFFFIKTTKQQINLGFKNIDLNATVWPVLATISCMEMRWLNTFNDHQSCNEKKKWRSNHQIFYGMRIKFEIKKLDDEVWLKITP